MNRFDIALAICALACTLVLAACDARERGSQAMEVSQAVQSNSADFVMRGAAIYTMDPETPWAEALAVRDGQIVYVGSEEGVASLIGENSTVEDLAGKMVLPGMQDAHVHPISGGMEALACDLNAATSLDGVLELIQACADSNPEETWISGGGWSMSTFGPGALASKELLDAIVPDRPVYLESADGHTAWVNSKALEIAGIDRDTAEPADGRIDRNPNTGDPVGSLQEGAADLVEEHLPPVTAQRRLEGLRYSLKMLNGLGITAIQDANVSESDLQAYASLDQTGELTMRVVASQWWERDQGLEQISGLVSNRKAFTGGRLDAGTVKIMQDGVMENYTAAMLEPYLVEGSPSGIPMVKPELLKEVVAALDAEGFQVHFHAIGDAAVRQSLDAIEFAQASNDGSANRHHISHLELIDPADIPRFARLDVTANFQPLWAYPDSYITDLTLPFIGPERGQWLYPIGSVMESGGRVAFGSDWSVSTANPFVQIEVAVRRSDPRKADGAVLLPEQAVSLAQAIEAFTINAAWVNRIEKQTGSLEVGKAADLIVVDRNLFEIDPREISETQVMMTMVEGKIVYQHAPDANSE